MDFQAKTDLKIYEQYRLSCLFQVSDGTFLILCVRHNTDAHYTCIRFSLFGADFTINVSLNTSKTWRILLLVLMITCCI